MLPDGPRFTIYLNIKEYRKVKIEKFIQRKSENSHKGNLILNYIENCSIQVILMTMFMQL